MWGGVAVDPVLVSVPMFIFMGSILERSGSAKDMLLATEILLKRVPGGARGRRHGDGHDPRRADRRRRRRGGAALGDRAAADAGVRLQQAARHRHDRVGRNARHPDPAGHHAGGHGGDAQHLGRRAVRRRDHAGLSAVGALSRLHHRDRDHQTRLGAEAAGRLRAADARRVLAHDVAGPVPHDLPDGRGARLDLRRLGDRDRKRRRRRARRPSSSRGSTAA